MSFENIHVLVIDDNFDDADILKKLLDRLEITYDVVFDGREVAAQIEPLRTPDIVFLDLEMPAITGYEVIEAIRDVEGFADVPVIAYSAHFAAMATARRRGFNGFLGKPLRSKSFEEYVRRILNGEEIWEAS